MSYTVYCDKCNQVIKPGDKKYAYVVEEAIQEQGNAKNLNEIFQTYKRNYKDPEVFEICERCKKLYDFFFKKTRLNDLKTLEEEIDKLEPRQIEYIKEDSEYCQCDIPCDAGLILEGEPISVCSLCGKKIKIEEEE